MKAKATTSGFTLIELLVVIAIIGTIAVTAWAGINGVNNRSLGAANVLSGTLSAARTQAMSTTRAVRVDMNPTTGLTVFSAPLCTSASAEWTEVTSLREPRPERVTLTPDNTTAWQVCFNSRGLASATRNFTVRDERGRVKQVQVYLSGAVVTQ